MSDLLSLLFSFQPDSPELKSNVEYDRQARTFIVNLSNVSTTHYLKGADTTQDLLEILNPAVNSIAYCFALLARVSTAGEQPKAQKHIPDTFRPQGTGWRKLAEFMETFDPIQVRYVGAEWRRLVEYMERVARVMGTPGAAISPIRSAMIRLDPSTGTFTSNHLLFIRLCMETRSYAAALPILDNYIHSVPSSIPRQVIELESSVPCAEHTNSGEYINSRSGHSEKITVGNVQEYYVLGAMAYIGLHQYKKAMGFLEHVLVTPSSNLANGLMVEAYKKWVLVSCLANGMLSTVPRTANVPAMKSIRSLSKAYEALAAAFQAMDFKKLRAQADVGTPFWADDGNTGLVSELLEAQYRVFISRLQQTYSAIPLSNVANITGINLEELEPYLQKLIKDGYLNARIDRVTKPEAVVVLRFFPDPTQGPLAKTEKQQQQALLEQTERTNLLAAQVKAVDYRFSLTKEYLEHLKRQSKKAAANASGEAMDTTWDETAEGEEDMMADLH